MHLCENRAIEKGITRVLMRNDDKSLVWFLLFLFPPGVVHTTHGPFWSENTVPQFASQTERVCSLAFSVIHFAPNNENKFATIYSESRFICTQVPFTLWGGSLGLSCGGMSEGRSCLVSALFPIVFTPGFYTGNHQCSYKHFVFTRLSVRRVLAQQSKFSKFNKHTW